MDENQTIQSIQPLNLLQSFANTHENGCLKVSTGSLSWWIYFNNHRLSYAYHASEYGSKFALNQLQSRLKQTDPKSFQLLKSRVQDYLASELQGQLPAQHLESKVIFWLVKEQHLSDGQAKKLMEKSTLEALESFLTLTKGSYNINLQTPEFPVSNECDLETAVKYCQIRLQKWQSLAPHITSPYQRAFIVKQEAFHNSDYLSNASPELKSKLISILQGYSIRHIASSLRQDELKIAKFLYPYIINKSVSLKAPAAPFDETYQINADILQPSQSIKYEIEKSIEIFSSASPTEPRQQRKAKPVIVCVDDSRNTLNEIERLLGRENFSFFQFLEPTKAVFQFRVINPDIILLDLTMPKINGYELCRMLRNHPGFEKTPIVIVTGKKGFIDRVKAKSVGATDYLTKPFTRNELLAIVSRYVEG